MHQNSMLMIIQKLNLSHCRLAIASVAAISLVAAAYQLSGEREEKLDRSRVRLINFEIQQLPQPASTGSGSTSNQPNASTGPLAPAAVQNEANSGRFDAPKLVDPFGNSGTNPTLNLVGSKACGECHPTEHAQHFGSGHSRTLRPAGRTAIARELDGKVYPDPENAGVLWRYIVNGDRLEAEKIGDGEPECHAIDFAIGSGEQGMSFLSLLFNKNLKQFQGLEHRLSFYRSGQCMDVTPGQGEKDQAGSNISRDKAGRLMDQRSMVKCLDCHSTVTSRSKPGDFDLPALVPNIGCERCHGPGREHVEAARKGLNELALEMPLGARSATPNRQIRECGNCHRRVDNVPPNQIHPMNYELARFQPLGLESSLCFQRGKSGLKCTSCHDPHSKVSRERPSYNKVCVDCHQQPDRFMCKVEPKGDCIQCHMPKRTVSEVFQFTDHWIRREK
jgi:hypothetical protein